MAVPGLMETFGLETTFYLVSNSYLIWYQRTIAIHNHEAL